MIFTHDVVVDRPVEEVWPVLVDVPRVAPCFPGASVAVSSSDPSAYAGTVEIRIGPIVATYAGTARLVSVDEAGRRIVIDARGRDRKGAGLASADVDVRVSPRADGTLLVVTTDLRVTGRVAQFGSAVLEHVAAERLRQFAANLAGLLTAA